MPLLFWFNLFWRLGQKSKNNFVHFWGKWAQENLLLKFSDLYRPTFFYISFRRKWIWRLRGQRVGQYYWNEKSRQKRVSTNFGQGQSYNPDAGWYIPILRPIFRRPQKTTSGPLEPEGARRTISFPNFWQWYIEAKPYYFKWLNYGPPPYYFTFHCALAWQILKLLSNFQGTGVGDTRNPSDLVSQGLDPKNSSDSLRLRFHVRNGLPRAISATQKDHGWDAIVWKVQL